ncbi:MAG TPA: hypothetical protein VFK04_07245 [Gemmatimonadaceae bacterium]|jgi:hypothetical protein|nr:hypothetical protein [Gemmatimonadaceae bacterium]
MRYALISPILLAALSTSALSAQGPDSATAQPSHAATDQALIANALSAAPPSVAATASVQTADGRVLRKGTSDWVCMPDMPEVPNNSPMCLDSEWRGVIDAWMHKSKPTITKMGFGYMLQGDLPVSNTDPFATAPTATNQWIQDGYPHVMILVPDSKLLEAVSTDPTNGGPFVMWKGTPYAHIMVPTVPPGK